MKIKIVLSIFIYMFYEFIKGRVKFPKKDIFIPSIITNPAPNDAPDDTPKVYGDASSFFKTDWTTDPLTAREPPTKKASRTLGTLRDQIIDTSFWFILSTSGKLNILCISICAVSNKLILELPIEVPIQKIINTIGIENNANFLFLVYIWVYCLCHFI